jgi:hypothetical protein
MLRSSSLPQGCQAPQINVVCANRQSPVSEWSTLWLRRWKLGRRQVFALCYVLCCNSAAFSWKSALAPILAPFTSEVELISVASCAQEVNFCRKLATELGFIQPGPTPIVQDITGSITLLESLVLRVQLHRHWRPPPRSDPDTRPAR